jgi:DNA invertase Pin-like site-specific DNA recombinase
LKGITGGRKKGLSEEAQKKAKEVRKLYLSRDPAYSVREISSMLNISTRTVYKYLDFLGVPRRGEGLY